MSWSRSTPSYVESLCDGSKGLELLRSMTDCRDIIPSYVDMIITRRRMDAVVAGSQKSAVLAGNFGSIDIG